MLIAILAMLLLMAAWYSWTSKMNQLFFFGRTVPAGFAATPQARRITRRYRLQLWLGSIPALAVCLLLYRPFGKAAGLPALACEILAYMLAFAQAHRDAGRLAPAPEPSVAVEVPLAAAATKNPPSVLALLAPIAAVIVVLAVAAGIVAARTSLAAAPAALGALLEAHGADTMASFGFGLCFAGLAALLIRTQARSRTPLGYNALWASVIATWTGVAITTFAMIAAFAGNRITQMETRIVMGVIAAIAFSLVIFRTIVYGRYTPPPAEMQADACWRWGLFYVNRNDPAVFVQCRCGAGYTLNYGRAMAWPICAIFVAFFVTLVVVARPR